MLLSALLGQDAVFEPGKTLLVLDEIQDCPDARTALKFFKLDGRYDVIGTGSLLGVRGYGSKEPKSIPVGYETVLDMSPLDFEEFLWATALQSRSSPFCANACKTARLCRRRCTSVCGNFYCNIPL